MVVGRDIRERSPVAISTCVCEMNSRIAATRRFISFMVVRFGFKCFSLDFVPASFPFLA